MGDIQKDAQKKKDSEKYKCYCQIFGEGRKPAPDQALADRVLLEHHSARKMAQDAGQVPPKCDLTSYIIKEGHRQSDDYVESPHWWDKEVFLTRIKAYRPWTAERAMDEWSKLERNPAIKRDNVGMNGSLALQIPAEMLGEVTSESRRGSFQERAVETATKAQKLTKHARDVWIKETAAGFSNPGLMGAEST